MAPEIFYDHNYKLYSLIALISVLISVASLYTKYQKDLLKKMREQRSQKLEVYKGLEAVARRQKVSPIRIKQLFL